MRNVLIVLALFFIASNAFSQKLHPDFSRTTLSSQDWAERRINKQITRYQLKNEEFYGEPQSINILKVNLNKNKYGIDVVFADSSNELLSEMAAKHHGVAAINGTFFNVKKGGAVVFLKVDDHVITPPNTTLNTLVSEAALLIGDSVVVVENTKDKRLKMYSNFEDIMVSGPLLLKNGEVVKPDSTAFNRTKHPRSAIGITYDYELLMVTVDGRHEGKASGIAIRDLAVLMKALNCKDAMNLDGGGSTTLWLKKEGVINYPSDNKVFDHEGARKVANGIVVVRN
jgi:exopolysaccharide biosynthesis protein